ncbi:MAG: DUF192 domain-containing protein [Candidatus Dormibacteria bacterium]
MSAELNRAAATPPVDREVAIQFPGGGVARVAIARSVMSRFMGLMGRAQLAPDQGLWLIPCRSIHMFFMRAPIDVAFVNRQGSVVRTVAGMRPWSLRPLSVTVMPVKGAHSTLELAPGTLARLKVEVGTQLSHRPSGAPASRTEGSRSAYAAPAPTPGD